jgi:hypothetical protein
MNNAKKSRKKLYGFTTENLENNNTEIIQTIGSLKFLKNKKIGQQLKITHNGESIDGSDDNNYDIFDIYKSKSKSKPKASYHDNEPITKISKTCISISYHKSKPKKYCGSKSKKYCGSKSKLKKKSKTTYGAVPICNQNDNDVVPIKRKHKKIDLL